MTLANRIKSLQSRLGVPADGVVGPVTVAMIERLLDERDAATAPKQTLGIRTPDSGVSAATGHPGGPIGMIDHSLLRAICPNVGPEWVEPIRKACAEYEINTIRRVAAFIAQMAHESMCFSRTAENLNYSALRLTEVWPARFPSLARAQPYARNPEALANKVYANRLGNGDEASGDGWRFRGGGPLQLTGRDNWTRFAAAVGMPLDQALVWGRTPEGGVMAAAWFWEANDINRLADTPGVADESRRINGGSHGLADREAKFNALVAEMLKRERA